MLCFTFEALLHGGANGRSYRELVVWLNLTGRLGMIMFDEADHLVQTSWRSSLRNARKILLLLEVDGTGDGEDGQARGGKDRVGAIRRPLRVVDVSGTELSRRPPSVPSVTVYMPSATIPDDVITLVAENLDLPKSRIRLVRRETDRPNLLYAVELMPLATDLPGIVEALFRRATFISVAAGVPTQRKDGRAMKTMVFVHLKIEAERLAARHNSTPWMVWHFGHACAVHSGLKNKSEELEKWSRGADNTRVVFCTQALGFGLDRDDVNLVLLPKPYMDLKQLTQVIGRAGRGDFLGLVLFAWHPGLLSTYAVYWGGVGGPGGEQIRKLAQFLDGSGCRRAVLAAAAGSPATECSGCDVHNPAMAHNSSHPAAVMFLTDPVARAFSVIGATETLLWRAYVARVQVRFKEVPVIDDMVAVRALSYLIRSGDLELLYHQPLGGDGWAPTLQVRVRPSHRSEHAVPTRPRLAQCIPAASTAGPAVRRLLGLSTVELTDVAAAVHDVGLWADADDVDGFMDALDLGDDDRPAGRE